MMTYCKIKHGLHIAFLLMSVEQMEFTSFISWRKPAEP